MSGVILQTVAIEIQNKGGGYPTKTTREIYENVLGQKKSKLMHLQSREKVKGSDYVIFRCPGCNQRNRKCVYEAKGNTGDDRLSFICHRCRREIEVARPAPPLILESTKSPVARLVDAKGNPLHA